MKRLISVLAVALLLLNSFGFSLAHALSDEQIKIFRDNIHYFNVDSCGTASSGNSTPTIGCCDSSAAQLTGSNDGERVWNFFADPSRGLTKLQVAAIVGNLQQESKFSPTADNGKGYYGLAQWGGDRLTKLKTKPSYTDLSVQLNYAWEELTGGFSDVLSKLKTAPNLQEMVYVVVKYYEGATDANQPRGVQDYYKRLAYATTWSNKADGGAGSGAAATTSDLSGSDTGCGNNSGVDGYSNPFHDMTNLTVSRIDEGVDYAAKAGTAVPVYAIGNGTVTKVAKGDSTFYPKLPNWITYQLADGPAKGKYVYVAEACTPKVKEGDSVTTNTNLCDAEPASIETGWALDATSQAAAALSTYHEGDVTAYGVNFNQLMVKLGVPSGNAATNPVGSLPPDWPNW